jgi:hypothetical protein
MFLHERRMFFPTFGERFDFSVEPFQEFLSVLNKSLDGYYLVAGWNIVGVELCNKRRDGGHREDAESLNVLTASGMLLYHIVEAVTSPLTEAISCATVS